MPGLLQEKRGELSATDELPRPRRVWFLVCVLLLGGFLLLAHGCHGNEDNELFALYRCWLMGP